MAAGQVVKFDEMQKQMDCSEASIRQRLAKLGAMSSLNRNNRYYILPDNCEFDANGLYRERGCVFHRARRLLPTIAALVEQSEAGLSALELSELMGTNVGTKMAKVFKDGLVSREVDSAHRVRRGVVPHRFFSAEESIRQRQIEAREALNLAEKHRQEQAQAEAAAAAADEISPRPPLGVSEAEVIDLLLLILEKRDYSEKSLALSLQRGGKNPNMTVENVQKIFAHYGLKGKKH